jgi:hypothetical protein
MDNKRNTCAIRIRIPAGIDQRVLPFWRLFGNLPRALD